MLSHSSLASSSSSAILAKTSIEIKDIILTSENLLKILRDNKADEIKALTEIKALIDAKADKTAILNYADEKDGSTPLHVAVANNQPTVVKILIDWGAKTFITDHEFKSPLQRAAEHSSVDTQPSGAPPVEPIFSQLLLKRTTLEEKDLEEVIDFCREFYYINDEKQKPKNQNLLDFCVSRLTGVDVFKLLRNQHAGRGTIVRPGITNRDLYLAHLNSFAGEKRSLSVERWYWEEFLPLRIRSFFELMIKAELYGNASRPLPHSLYSKNKPILKNGWRSVYQAFKQEILVELESLHIHNCVWAISKLSSEAKKNFGRLALAKNIATRLQQLPKGQELSFAGGWQEHATYISFMKLEDNSVVVRVDNAGYGATAVYCTASFPGVGDWLRVGLPDTNQIWKDFYSQVTLPFYPLSTSSAWNLLHLKPTTTSYFKKKDKRGSTVDKILDQRLYPCVLGVMPPEAYDPVQATLPYLVRLMAAYESPTIESAFPKIYNLLEAGTIAGGQFIPTRIPTPQELRLSPAKSQTVSNCVVKNHQIGLQHRLTPYLAFEEQKKDDSELKIVSYHRHKFYRWIRDEEQKFVSPALTECKSDYTPYWTYYQNPRRFPEQFKEKLKTRLQAQDPIRPLFAKDMFPSTVKPKYIPTSLSEQVEDKTQTDQKEENTEGSAAVKSKVMKAVPISLSNIYDHYLSKKQSVFVQGRAGMGKSSFCRYVAHSWAKGELWQKHFDWVFLIPLRNLNSDQYPSGKDYSEFDIVKKECFPEEIFSDYAEKQLKNLIANTDESILWLFDSHEELPTPIPEQLKDAMHSLFKKNYLMMTARYHLPIELGIQSHIEMGGFNRKAISKYIHNFFKEEKKALPADSKDEAKRASENSLEDFVTENPVVLDIAKIPINLELICSIWYADRSRLQKAENLTKTKLYHMIMIWLMQRFLAPDKNQPMRLEDKKDENRILRRLGKEIESLGKIAFEMYKLKKLTVSQKELERIIPEVKEDSGLRDDIVNIGLLGSLSKLSDAKAERTKKANLYDFMHPSFKEFILALYFISGLMADPRSEPHQAVVIFIEKEKYNVSYRSIIEYMADLLSLSHVNKKSKDVFFQSLHSLPHDLSQIKHVSLLIDCLKRAWNEGDEAYPPVIECIKNFLMTFFKELNVKFFSHTDLEKLKEFPATSYHLIIHPELCEPFIRALAFIDKRDRGNWTVLYSLIKAKKMERGQLEMIIALLEKLIFEGEYTVSKYAMLVLSSISSMKKAWLSVQDKLILAAKDKHKSKLLLKRKAINLLGSLGILDDNTVDTLIDIFSIANAHDVEYRLLALKVIHYFNYYNKKLKLAITQAKECDPDEGVKEEASVLLREMSAKEADDSCDSPMETWGYAPIEPDEGNSEASDSETNHLDFEGFYNYQRLSDYWILYGCFNNRNKESGKEELVKREREEKNISVIVRSEHRYSLTEDRKGFVEDKSREVKVSKRVADWHNVLKLNEENVSAVTIETFTDEYLKRLLEHKIHFVETKTENLIKAFINKPTDALGELIAQHVFKMGVSITVTEESIVVYGKEVILIKANIEVRNKLLEIFKKFDEEHGMPTSSLAERSLSADSRSHFTPVVVPAASEPIGEESKLEARLSGVSSSQETAHGTKRQGSGSQESDDSDDDFSLSVSERIVAAGTGLRKNVKKQKTTGSTSSSSSSTASIVAALSPNIAVTADPTTALVVPTAPQASGVLVPVSPRMIESFILPAATLPSSSAVVLGSASDQSSTPSLP